MRFFSRRHRCITYSARGYLPSDVPKDWKDYSYKHWVDDAVAVLDHLKIDKAHFVGLSMGGYTADRWAASNPRAAVADAAGAGSGSERADIEEFRKNLQARTDDFEKQGHAEVVQAYGLSPARISVPGQGPARLRRVQQDVRLARPQGCAQPCAVSRPSGRRSTTSRPSIRKIKVPTLIVVGDEDDRAWSRASCSSSGCRRRARGDAKDRSLCEPGGGRPLFNEASPTSRRVEAGRLAAARSAVVVGSRQLGPFWSSSCAWLDPRSDAVLADSLCSAMTQSGLQGIKQTRSSSKDFVSMLSQEHNDLITRTSGHCGRRLLRRYGQPVALVDELQGNRRSSRSS
jgi:pimeloyl-ACP methyl ester carboxylesterase